MQPIVTDGLAWSVGQCVMIMSPAKTAELFETPFGMWTLMGSRNHILDRVQIAPCEGAILKGKSGGPL